MPLPQFLKREPLFTNGCNTPRLITTLTSLLPLVAWPRSDSPLFQSLTPSRAETLSSLTQLSQILSTKFGLARTTNRLPRSQSHSDSIRSQAGTRAKIPHTSKATPYNLALLNSNSKASLLTKRISSATTPSPLVPESTRMTRPPLSTPFPSSNTKPPLVSPSLTSPLSTRNKWRKTNRSSSNPSKKAVRPRSLKPSPTTRVMKSGLSSQ